MKTTIEWTRWCPLLPEGKVLSFNYHSASPEQGGGGAKTSQTPWEGDYVNCSYDNQPAQQTK